MIAANVAIVAVTAVTAATGGAGIAAIAGIAVVTAARIVVATVVGSAGGDRAGAEKSRYPEAKLRALARRAAEKAAETGKAITINLELNSYDRRIVHMEVAEIDGVGSRSEEREDGVKIIQVYPALAE
jgi:hypothetical protein